MEKKGGGGGVGRDKSEGRCVHMNQRAPGKIPSSPPYS